MRTFLSRRGLRLPVLSRRDVGRAAALSLLAAATGCRDRNDSSVERIYIGSVDELASGAPLAFEHPELGPCFAIALEGPAMMGIGPDSSIVAFSTICPHMGCPLGIPSADPQTGHFGPCGCHQSVFDLRNDGRMVYGRATSNLARIELEIEGDELFALHATRLGYGQALTEDHAVTPAPSDDGEDDHGAA